jgi:hypothetical protein
MVTVRSLAGATVSSRPVVRYEPLPPGSSSLALKRPSDRRPPSCTATSMGSPTRVRDSSLWPAGGGPEGDIIRTKATPGRTIARRSSSPAAASRSRPPADDVQGVSQPAGLVPELGLPIVNPD